MCFSLSYISTAVLLPRVPVVAVLVSSSLFWQGCTVSAAAVDCIHTEGQWERRDMVMDW